MQNLLDLNTVITRFASRVRPVAGDKAALRTQLDPNLGPIVADAKIIDWLLVNLAADAYDVMPSGGELLISTANVDLDESAAAAVNLPAGPYIRMEFASAAGGLDAGATVRNMVQQLRGAVAARATCGSGVLIEVLLPRIVEAQTERKNQTPVVLVVSDDATTRELTCDLLRDAGYEVLEAAHGKDAEAVLSGSEVDLMITDIVMPEQDGLETILAVRAVHPGLKIIAVGDRPGGYQVRTAKLLGANAVMSKPLTRCVLCDAVREQIGAARRQV